MLYFFRKGQRAEITWACCACLLLQVISCWRWVSTIEMKWVNAIEMKQGWSGLEHMVYGEKGGGEDLLAVISYLFGIMEKAEPKHLRDAQRKARRPQGKLQVDVSQMFLLGVAWHWSRGPEGCEIASLQILIMRQDEALSTPTRSCSPALSRGWTRDHQMSVPASAAL